MTLNSWLSLFPHRWTTHETQCSLNEREEFFKMVHKSISIIFLFNNRSQYPNHTVFSLPWIEDHFWHPIQGNSGLKKALKRCVLDSYLESNFKRKGKKTMTVGKKKKNLQIKLINKFPSKRSSWGGAIHSRFNLVDSVADEVVDRAHRLGADPCCRHVADEDLEDDGDEWSRWWPGGWVHVGARGCPVTASHIVEVVRPAAIGRYCEPRWQQGDEGGVLTAHRHVDRGQIDRAVDN